MQPDVASDVDGGPLNSVDVLVGSVRSSQSTEVLGVRHSGGRQLH